MTTIWLHGILREEFGERFRMELDRPRDVIAAISASRPAFRKRVVELTREGVCYSVVIDGKTAKPEDLEVTKRPQEVHLMPAIMGSGIELGIGALITGSAFWAGVIDFAILTIVSAAISYALAPKPDTPAPREVAVGGLQESFVFANKGNVSRQGVPVPIGYGRLRVGSLVIQATLKSYPQTTSTIEEFSMAPLGEQSASAPVMTNLAE